MYKETLNEIFNTTFKYGKSITLTSIPLLILSFVFIVLINLLQKVLFPNSFLLTNSIQIFSNFIFLVIYSSIIAKTFRIILLDEKYDIVDSLFIKKREIKLFLYNLLLNFIIFTVTFSLALIYGFFSFNLSTLIPLVFILLSLFLSSYSLIFPSIAVDKKLNIKETFQITQNKKFYTYFFIIMTPIIFAFLVGGVYSFLILLLAKISKYFLIIFIPLLFFIFIFTLSCVAITYKKLLEKEDKEEIETKIDIQRENSSYFITIPKNQEVNFEYLKFIVTNSYSKLDSCEIIVDEEDIYMLKNYEIEDSYVKVEKIQEYFIIEVHNIPRLDIIEKIEAIKLKEPTIKKHNSEIGYKIIGLILFILIFAFFSILTYRIIGKYKNNKITHVGNFVKLNKNLKGININQGNEKLQKEINKILTKYNTYKLHKAIAFAIDANGRYAYGYASNHKTNEIAQKKHLTFVKMQDPNIK